jgi:hypothetical protein
MNVYLKFCFGLSSNSVEWRLERILTGPKEIGLVMWTEEVEPVQWRDTGDSHIEHLVLLPVHCVHMLKHLFGTSMLK